MFQVNIENKLIKSYNKKKNEAIHSFLLSTFYYFRDEILNKNSNYIQTFPYVDQVIQLNNNFLIIVYT